MSPGLEVRSVNCNQSRKVYNGSCIMGPHRTGMVIFRHLVDNIKKGMKSNAIRNVGLYVNIKI